MSGRCPAIPMHHSIWPTFTLQEEELYSHRIGPLTLFIRKKFNEVWVACQRDLISGEKKPVSESKPKKETPVPLPEKPDWQRFALPDAINSFRLLPVFPDRPVVIDSEYNYRILKNARSRVYSRIPVQVRIEAGPSPGIVLAEIPTRILSGTWFGVFTEGELCYALSSTTRREITPDLIEPHLVFCPMSIINQSGQDLRFEKICLRVDRLSIFFHEKGLWADETRILHKGKEGYSDIEMTGTAPEEAQSGILLGKPRNTVTKSAAERTFKLIRDITVPGFSS